MEKVFFLPIFISKFSLNKNEKLFLSLSQYSLVVEEKIMNNCEVYNVCQANNLIAI